MISNKLYNLLIITLLSITININAQNVGVDNPNGIDTELEYLLEFYIQQGNSQDIDLIQVLDQYKLSPISLNTSSHKELSGFPFFTAKHIQEILLHRSRYKQFVSIAELNILPSFSPRFVQAISPYFSLKSNKGSQEKISSIRFKQDFIIRYSQIIEELEDKNYLGSPEKILIRYKGFKSDRITFGFTLEKDAGEYFFKANNKPKIKNFNTGFDFFSAHLMIKPNHKIIKQINVGDYNLRVGQGLVIWNGFGIGKSPSVLGIKKSSSTITRFSSSNEFNFLRGASISLKHKKWLITPYVSSRRLDASIVNLDNNNNVTLLGSIQETGLHRKLSEISKQKVVRQNIYGTHISRNGKYYLLGFTYHHESFDNDFEKKTKVFQIKNTRNRTNNYLGFNYTYAKKNYTFYGENAFLAENKALALNNGFIYFPSSSIDLVIVHRYYSPGYYATFENAFAESKANNEYGLYLGTEIQVVKQLKISAYYDLYTFPWLTSSASKPYTGGADILFQANYEISSKMSIYWRFKYEEKDKNSSSDVLDPIFNTKSLMRNRLHFQYEISRYLKIKNRIEISTSNNQQKTEMGFLVYQDISYYFKKKKLKLTGRVAYYDTPSFSTAIYAYENDVLYSFSIPAYFGTDVRVYLIAKHRIKKGIDFWLRISRNTNLTKGTEFKAQLRFQL